jgi:hypothetical protein
MYRVDVADRVLRAWRSVAGSSFVHHPCWDLLVLIEVLPGPPDVYPPWIDFGLRGLTGEVMRRRVEEYLVSVMARL